MVSGSPFSAQMRATFCNPPLQPPPGIAVIDMGPTPPPMPQHEGTRTRVQEQPIRPPRRAVKLDGAQQALPKMEHTAARRKGFYPLPTWRIPEAGA